MKSQRLIQMLAGTSKMAALALLQNVGPHRPRIWIPYASGLVGRSTIGHITESTLAFLLYSTVRYIVHPFPSAYQMLEIELVIIGYSLPITNQQKEQKVAECS